MDAIRAALKEGTLPVLSDDQVKELWQRATPFPEWEGWQKNYQELLVKVRNLSDEQLAQPENQKLLWSADAILRSPRFQLAREHEAPGAPVRPSYDLYATGIHCGGRGTATKGGARGRSFWYRPC